MKIRHNDLWNGNESYTAIEDNQIIHRDVMPAKNVQALLDSNADIRNHSSPNRRAHGRLVASIPGPLHREWKKEWRNEGGTESWEAYVKVKLNDPANAFLRLTKGTI